MLRGLKKLSIDCSNASGGGSNRTGDTKIKAFDEC